MKKAVFFLSALGLGLYLTQFLSGRRSKLIPESLLDLNSASQEELLALAGIGEVFAGRIIENRPYATKIDLIGRRIIPDEAYKMIKRAITVAHREAA